jgi:hypothetical protein
MSEFLADGVITPYNELICIAGMRSGKSFLGAHVGGYVEHVLRVFSMKGRTSLQRMLHQEKAEWFEVTFAASTATQARDTIYAKYREMRNNSPWINRHIGWVKEQEQKQVGSHDRWEYKALDDIIVDGWMQVRFNRVASNSAGVAGRTRIFAAIDELARLADSESKTSAQELYRVLNQSLKTVRGAVRKYDLFPHFGMMLNVTSPLSIDGYDMQIYNQTATGQRKRTYGWKGATWEFNPELEFEDFKDEFEKDPIAAQRDFGADPPAAQTPLVNDPLRFWKSIDFSRQPIAKFETILITDATDKKYVGAKLVDLRYNFQDVHYIFCDAAETFDSFAMVCAHPMMSGSGNFRQELEQRNEGAVQLPSTGKHVSELVSRADSPMSLGMQNVKNPNMIWNRNSQLSQLSTVYDFCMRIIPTKDRDIWFASIIEIIKELKKKIKIGAVCFDQWQSTSAIQEIRDLGIPAYKYSLRNENFLEFLSHTYNDQVSMLPPVPDDHFGLSDKGTLMIGRPEEEMSGEAVGILEMFKLERSTDLRRVLAPDRKGTVRGRNSDDIARCIVGANAIVKDSVVNNLLDSGKKREIRKKLMSTGNNQRSQIWTPNPSGAKKPPF